MLEKLTRLTMVSVLALVLVAGLGCDAVPTNGNGGGNGGNGGGGGGGNGTSLTLVKTNIDVRHDAAIKAGDDLIAFGTGTHAGVSYIIPSTSPTTGTAVPNSDLYDSGAFAVGSASNYIFLPGANTGSLAFQLSVFDLATQTITKTFTTGEIRLCGIPISPDDPGNIQADGAYCVVACDPNVVDDAKTFKLVDASASPPTVTAFATNPVDSCGIAQMAISATSRKAVAVVGSTFFVYDIDSPATAPTQIAAPNGIGDFQIKMHNNTIIAFDNQNYEEAFLVDLSTNTIVTLTDALATGSCAIGGTVFAFFADTDAADSSGGHVRTAVGTVPGPGFTKAALDQSIDGSTVNNGLVGFAGSMSVTPNGSYVFLGDWYLQVSAGNAVFAVLADPDGSDSNGCPAWDVDCTNNTVAFKTAPARTTSTSDGRHVGYIILP